MGRARALGVWGGARLLVGGPGLYTTCCGGLWWSWGLGWLAGGQSRGPGGPGASAGPLMGRTSSWGLWLWGLKVLELVLAFCGQCLGPEFVAAGPWGFLGWCLPQVGGAGAHQISGLVPDPWCVRPGLGLVLAHWCVGLGQTTSCVCVYVYVSGSRGSQCWWWPTCRWVRVLGPMVGGVTYWDGWGLRGFYSNQPAGG